MEKRARMRDAGKLVAPWLLEGIFIALSVLLGFAAAQYGEDRTNKELADRALTGLHAELEHNLAMVEPYVAFHRAYIEKLRQLPDESQDQSGFQVYLNVRPELPKHSETDVPIVRRAAWDAAVSSGALRLLDYDLVAGLSEIYQMQEHLASATARIPITSQAFFDPRDRDATVGQTRAALGEIMWAEQSLLTLYLKQLPALQAAAQ
jgi:hypothetical protein